MRVALTGVSGFIGSVIARHLRRAGHSVAGLVRPTSLRAHVEPHVDRFVVGDQADPEAWADLLDGAGCVIHNSVDWAPLRDPVDLVGHLEGNLAGSIRLLEASAPRQFVFISTVAAHHDIRPRWGGRIDEDHPLRPFSLYGAYKAAVEPHLWAAHYNSGRHTCALRPCGVYGVDPNLSRSIGYTIVESIKAGEPFSRPAGGKFVHVEDVAAAVVATVGNPESAGRAYNLVDCYARWADWAQMAAELLGTGVEIDMSSPPAPKNMFTKDAARTLGVELDRGHEGIREHLRELIALMP
jgi:nucleoside-diphosphate-sugar epimerase